ncbi:MAG: aminotransferase [Candidatus Marinimicrobia bacterium]|nr:aminotransferase [Candidatus Neomarinimicrobiota bacterium]
MNKKISFAGPWITKKEIEYVIDATKNGWYETFDKDTKNLEMAIQNYLGVKHAIATHCCTVALHLACEALQFNEGDEVICTDFSWIATGYAIAYTKAKPVFVDIDEKTWCISPSAIKKAITNKTKAIMLVHSFGYPAKMDEIMKIAKQNNLRVIEDAAPALGAEFGNKMVGTFGDFGCFSFQGAKLTVSGEGGVIVTDSDKLYKKIRLLASMGRTDSKAVFWSDSLGYQYTMANLTAALALAQVERIEELIQKKKEIYYCYQQELGNVGNIKFVKEYKNSKSVHCYPSILLGDGLVRSRDEIIDILKAKNIHCRPAFPRMSRFPVFESRFKNPVAKNVELNGITLPSAANLDNNDIKYVCDNLKSLIL